MTTNSPEQRAAELSTTGVPHQFVVVYAERVRDCEKVERLLHQKLAALRVNPNREFFEMTTQAAVRAVLELAGPYRIDGGEGNDESPSHLPDPNDVLDQEIQAKVQQDKRIRRIMLRLEQKNDRAKAKGGP